MAGLGRNLPADAQAALDLLSAELPQWVLRHDRFEEKGHLGSGGFSSVLLVTDRDRRQDCAAKQLHTSTATVWVSMFCREIRTLVAAQGHGILKFFGFTNTFPYWIVTEFCSGGSLDQRIFRPEPRADDDDEEEDEEEEDSVPEFHPLTPTEKCLILIGASFSLKWLHAPGVVHLDYKVENIFLNDALRPILADFGNAILHSELSTTTQSFTIGTPESMSPEQIGNSAEINEKADVYGFGILIWCMFNEDVPFKGKNKPWIMRAVLGGARPEWSGNAPENLKNLGQSVLGTGSRNENIISGVMGNHYWRSLSLSWR
jgi:serine/threonine protein kinase